MPKRKKNRSNNKGGGRKWNPIYIAGGVLLVLFILYNLNMVETMDETVTLVIPASEIDDQDVVPIVQQQHSSTAARIAKVLNKPDDAVPPASPSMASSPSPNPAAAVPAPTPTPTPTTTPALEPKLVSETPVVEPYVSTASTSVAPPSAPPSGASNKKQHESPRGADIKYYVEPDPQWSTCMNPGDRKGKVEFFKRGETKYDPNENGDVPITVFTVGNVAGNKFCYFIASALRFGWNVHVLGWELFIDEVNTDYNLGMKLVIPNVWLKEFGIPDDRIVMMIDGFDSIIQYPLDEVYRRYQKLVKEHGKEFIAGSEVWCDKRWADQWDRILPDYPYTYRCINTGFYIGPAGRVKQMLDYAAAERVEWNSITHWWKPYPGKNKDFSNRQPKVPGRNDQYAIAMTYYKKVFKDWATLDYNVDFVFCIFNAQDDRGLDEKGRITNKLSRTTPIAAHWNGFSETYNFYDIIPNMTEALGGWQKDVGPVGFTWDNALFQQTFTFHGYDLTTVKFPLAKICSDHLAARSPNQRIRTTKRLGLQIEVGIDMMGGNDLRETTLENCTPEQSCLQDCYNYCKSHQPCEGWTIRDRRCYLKAEVAGRKPNKHVISGLLDYSDVEVEHV